MFAKLRETLCGWKVHIAAATLAVSAIAAYMDGGATKWELIFRLSEAAGMSAGRAAIAKVGKR